MILDNEKYKKVREAQSQGARSVKEVKDMTNIVIENDEELREVDRVIQNACRCQNVSVNEVVAAVKNGADTVGKVAGETNACTGCGRCKSVITNIIENKR